MLRKLLFVVMTGVFVCLPLAAVHAEVMHYPTEVTLYNPAKAYNGVTVFTPGGAPGKTFTYMIDMDGRLVHKVKTLGYSKFLENGRFLTTGNNAAAAYVIAEIGWSGGTLWSAPIRWSSMPAELVGKMQPWSVASMHHDMNKMWNNKLKAYTYLLTCSFTRTRDLGFALGATPQPTFNNGWYDDGLIEINSAGQIVWAWTFADHLVQNVDPAMPNYVADLATAPGRLDINVVSYPNNPPHITGPANDWTHVNSNNYNKQLGLVTLNSRGLNEFFIIDHDKTFVSTTDFTANVAAAAGTDGNFVYRFGNPNNYNQGLAQAWETNGHTQIWGAHNIQWIEPTMYTGGPALPGAGHMLIFDNHVGNENPLAGGTGSMLLEINPYVNGPGVGTPKVYPVSATFVNPPDAGYVKLSQFGFQFAAANVSNQVIWSFRSNNTGLMFSSHISSVSRLPNGNTIGDAGAQGHFFEVTPTGELAWEYSNPIMGGKAYKFQENQSYVSSFNVFRCHRYSASMPGLSTRLTQYPDGTIQPITTTVAGVGFTLTGQVPCRSVPCQYVGHP